MKRSRFTQEQIIGVLKEQQAGALASDLCRKLECAAGGGQFGRFELTSVAGLSEDGSHDETPIPQCGF